MDCKIASAIAASNMLPPKDENNKHAFLKALGMHLRVLRKARRMSAKVAAEKAGIDHARFLRVERGTESDFFDALEAIAAVVGTSATELVRAVVNKSKASSEPTSSDGPGNAILYAKIGSMDEGVLRRKVLEPLFRAMGFEHVAETHGGILEQGKDFVIWEKSLTGAIQCIGVVVKAGPVSGSAEHLSGTAATVAAQVRRCLNQMWPHPSTHGAVHVNKCWVIASGEIKKEARHSLDSEFTDDIKARLQYTDGLALYGLVERFLGAATVLDLLQEAANRMQAVSPQDHDTVAFSHAQGLSGFSLHPKVGADPIKFSVSFSEAGDLPAPGKIDAAIQTLKYGGKITNKDGLNVNIGPASLIAAMLPAGESFSEWSLQSVPKVHNTVLSFIALREGQVVGAWPHVVVSVQRIGENSLRLFVRDDREVLSLEMSQGEGDKQFSVSITERSENDWMVDARRLYQSIEFLDGLATAHELKIVDDRSGTVVSSANGPFSGQVVIGDLSRDFAKAAALVQTVLGRRIQLPPKGFPQSESTSILQLGKLLDRQVVSLPSSDAKLKVTGTIETVEAFLKRHASQESSSSPLLAEHPAEYVITGRKIGVFVNDLLINARLADQSVVELMNIAAEAKSSGETDDQKSYDLELNFVPMPHAKMRIDRSLASDIVSDLSD